MASKLSARKPLKDLSNNNGRYLKSVNPKKKCKEIGEKYNVNRVQQQDDEDGFLDRLLLVQSDLSSLTSQIDELVAQAFKLKTTSKEGSEEIESFMHVLSNMLSSLKPWVPRFQKALSSNFVEPENNFDVDSPDKIRMDSLISPSPLVSWRAGCNVERGRQLFLLTPLPISKTLSARHQGLPKSVFERIALHPAVELPSFSTVSRDGNEDLLEEMATKPTPSKPADSVANEGKLDRVSSPVFSKQNHSVVMTPCLKMSPPKSCVLLEPMSQSSHKGDNRFRKSTPFPHGIHSHISESLGVKALRIWLSSTQSY
ncbi:UDP-N-acetylglucosamine pyrophosphorylase [Salix suchowensis]|nr:UDP-N-acetylglucosamine pyrophosphorylase [Salix suchowensis]